MNGREQTQELHLSKVPPTQRHFLTSTSETSCWRSYGGRDGYEPSLTGTMRCRSAVWMRWMVFDASSYLIPSAYSILTVAPSEWICAHPLRSRRNSMSTRVEHARDRNLSRNLVANRRSSCLHQALYARHAIDAGSLCSNDSVPSWLSLSRQTSFTVQRFPRHFFLTLLKSGRWHP